MKSRMMMCAVVFALSAFVHGQTLLFEIGKADNNTAEFALGPNQSGQYSTAFPRDALFVAGKSNPKEDWPYIQPGPADAWAGGKAHVFTILMGLEAAPAAGTCTLHLDFVDTHSTQPPQLHIRVNGTVFNHQLPRGAGDPSAFGEVEKGREHVANIEFPATLLKGGTNTIAVENSTGSWFLYDYVALKGPDGVKTGPLTQTDELLGASSQPFLVARNGRLHQPVMVTLLHIGEPVEATITVEGGEPVRHALASGYKTIEGLAPAVTEARTVNVTVEVAGKLLGQPSVDIKPVRKWEIWLLHHSHVDIGYTHVQTDVLKKHFEYFDQVIELARKSVDYPAGSQFKWNAEVLWAVDSYLREAPPEKREAFIGAVKKGWIGLDALYGNQLTALCRPEELVRLVDCAVRLRKEHGVSINTAMITDVPGYTWGIVPVLAQAGVPYFSVGPNRGHRIGYTLSEWGDKPFYWRGPSGKEKVLTWLAGEGYSLFHSGRLSGDRLFEYLKRLEAANYPYDMLQVRYSIGGDNGPPDPGLADYVRDWNAKYAYPRLIVATTAEMFAEFEKRYADQIPTVAGDFTPYWEDGAASSAAETILNRAAADRLSQAEALFAMLRPGEYPDERFCQAWRNVILYDEHTWGAHNSISQPQSEFVLSQWRIKQAFALDADTQSKDLLAEALGGYGPLGAQVKAFDVINTCSWPRSEWVVLPSQWQLAAPSVCDHQGRGAPAMRLSDGRLAFVASDVPAFGSARYTLNAPPMHSLAVPACSASEDGELRSGDLTVKIDRRTGAIASLTCTGIDVDLAEGEAGFGLNAYFYVAGRDPKDPKGNGPVRISVKENGPVIASLVIESDAPGAHGLRREIRLTAGLDRVEIVDTIDKENVYAQEAAHIGFAFNVPGGVVRMDTPLAVVRPEVDQLAGACKNYFTVQRYVDVSNEQFGITLLTPDAPLIEIGGITNDPRAVGWMEALSPSTTIYSYVMNNYWETNYKASQEGLTTFRYAIVPHRGGFDGAAAMRAGVEASQPLLCVPVADEKTPTLRTLLNVRPDDVVVTALKPSVDGRAWIVRLFNPTGEARKVELEWAGRRVRGMMLSNSAEEEVERLAGPLELGPLEMVTLRVALPRGRR